MNIGEILEKSWKIFWRYKVLWIFGILASCSARSGGNIGGGANYRFSGNNFNFNNGNIPYEQLPPGVQNFIQRLQEAANNGTLWAAIGGIVLVAICLICILWLIQLVVGTFGRIGLVRGAWLADEGAERLTFGQLWKDSGRYFWRVLGFQVLLMLFGLVVAVIVVFFAIVTLGLGLCLALPLLIVGGWLLTVWTNETIVAIVGDDMNIFDAIGKAWNLIWQNIGPMALIGIILFVGGFIVALLISLPALLIIIPIIIGLVSQTTSAITTGLIVAGLLFLVYLPIAWFLNGLLQAYLGTNWTLIYRRLTGRGTASLVTAEPSAPIEPATPQETETFIPPTE